MEKLIWDSDKIENIFDVYGGTTPSTTKKEYWNGHIFWVTPTDLGKFASSIFLTDTEKKITELALNKNSLNIFNAGSILLSNRASVGLAAVNKFPVTINQGMTALVPKNKDKISSLYYVYYFSHIKKFLNQLATGRTFREISKSTIKKLMITIPPFQEQEKIADMLLTVDINIETVNKSIQKSEDLKKGLMEKFLKNYNEGNDFKVKSLSKKISAVQIKQLKDIAEIKRGASPRPINDKKWFLNNKSVGWVRISDVTKANKYLIDTTQYLSKEGIEKSRFVKSGNLIMSICATIGKPIILLKDVCIHDGFVVFDNLNIKLVEKEYLYYYLLKIAKEFKASSQIGTQANLNTTIVGLKKILLPTLEEQRKIADILSCNDKQSDLLKQKKSKLERIKTGLMNDLLTGRKRVKVEA